MRASLRGPLDGFPHGPGRQTGAMDDRLDEATVYEHPDVVVRRPRGT